MPKIEAIQVPFTPFLTYGIKTDGTLAFVYDHKTERAAQMTVSRISNGTHKYWDSGVLLQWGSVRIEDKHHNNGIWV
jgi:hypothetical protein